MLKLSGTRQRKTCYSKRVGLEIAELTHLAVVRARRYQGVIERVPGTLSIETPNAFDSRTSLCPILQRYVLEIREYGLECGLSH